MRCLFRDFCCCSVSFLKLPLVSLAENDDNRHDDADACQTANHATGDRADVGSRFRSGAVVLFAVCRTHSNGLVGNSGRGRRRQN